MAEAARSVSVVLKADIQDYVTKMGQASKATKDFAAQTGKVSGSASTATKNLGTSAKSASGDLDKATKSTKDFGNAAGKAATDADKASKSTKSVGDSAGTLGIGMAAAGAAIAAGIGLAVKAFADFDKEMSNVRAVSGATAGEMRTLTQAALEAGAATKFSASDAATAEAELVKAGISVKDVLGGGLRGALDLAAAGNIDLANAATVSANAMNIFGLEGKDVGRIADTLAAGANKSAADVDQLGQALQQSGLVAAQMGLSLEETTGILAAFADNGLKGSDAGTALKTMLQRLIPTSVAAASAMNDIGFSAYDAQGNMKDFDVVAGDLQKGLSRLTQKQKDATLATIFGSDAVRGANVLFKLGKAGVDDYTKGVTDAGAATRVAAVQMDNLSGDLENLKGSLETALIQGGSGANDALRDLAKSATSLVNAFAGLPPGAQKAVVEVAALTSGVLLLGGAALTTIPKIIATREAIDALALSAPRAAGALKVLGAAGASLAALSIVGPQVQRMWDNVAGANDDATRSLEAYIKAGENAEGVTQIMRMGLDDVGNAVNNVFSTSLGHNVSAVLSEIGTGFGLFGGTATDDAISFFDQMDKAMTGLVNSGNGDKAAEQFKRIATEAQAQGYSLDQVRQVLPGYTAAVEGAAVAGGKYVDSTKAFGSGLTGATGPAKLLGDELKEQEESAKAAETAYKNLTDAVKGYGSTLDGALGATSAYEASVDKGAERIQKRADIQKEIAKLQKEDAKGNADSIARLKKELEGYAATVDQGTEAGRANIGVLREQAQNAKDSAVANYDNGVAIGDVRKQMDSSRQTFIDQAIAFGATKEQARQMADQLGLTQTNLDKLATAADVKKTVTADTAQADTNLHSITRQLEQIDATVATATVQVTYERVGPSAEAITGLANGSLGFKGFADGGYTGPGGKFQPVGVVHGGEFVFTKEETSRAGVVNLAALARSLRGYASGGPVSPFADRGLVSSAMTTHNINGGATTNDNRIAIENLHGLTLEQVRRDTDRQRRLHALGRRGAR